MRSPGSRPSRPKRSAEMALAALLLAAPAEAADAARGQALLANRQASLCVLCHAIPGAAAHLQGDLGPDLRGVGGRMTSSEIRQRLLDPAQANPDTIMPAYGPRDGLIRVGRQWQDRPILPEAAIEDIVAYLATLKDE